MEESGRWKLICKALVQVRIQGLPVLQRSTHHYSQDRSPFLIRMVHHSKANDWVSPALQGHEKFEVTWAFLFIHVYSTDRHFSRTFGIKSIYEWWLTYGRKIWLSQKCPNELCWWTKKSNTENRALESLSSQKGFWYNFEPLNI